MQECIDDNGENKKKLKSSLNKLKKAESKEMKSPNEESSDQTHSDLSGDDDY